jgi:hypothetical protein
VISARPLAKRSSPHNLRFSRRPSIGVLSVNHREETQAMWRGSGSSTRRRRSSRASVGPSPRADGPAAAQRRVASSVQGQAARSAELVAGALRTRQHSRPDCTPIRASRFRCRPIRRRPRHERCDQLAAERIHGGLAGAGRETRATPSESEPLPPLFRFYRDNPIRFVQVCLSSASHRPSGREIQIRWVIVAPGRS